MKLKAFLSGLIFGMFLLATPALADACSDRARAIVKGEANATLLSVKFVQESNGTVTCEARIKISSPGSAPRIVVRKFRP